MNQALDGAEEIFLRRFFLPLLPELFPLRAFIHSSRCGLLACAAPQLGLDDFEARHLCRFNAHKILDVQPSRRFEN
jgi:hypothetical protein